MRYEYAADVDIVYIHVVDPAAKVGSTRMLTKDVWADLDAEGDLVGLEVFNPPRWLVRKAGG